MTEADDAEHRAEHREDDPVGESADEPAEIPSDAWDQIVANYGERVTLSADRRSEAEAITAHQFGDDVDEEPDWFHLDDSIVGPSDFVAPEEAPIGWHGWRSLAWLGVLGSPAAALLLAVVVNVSSWSMPSWIGAGLGLAFLGGFGYLVATMPKQREDPWDDGARL